MKTAFITGITGQDGSYLAELLLDKGYEVHGLIRRQSTIPTERIDHLYTDPHTPGCHFFLHYGDLADGTNLARLLGSILPDEIYNLGAQSHVRISFDEPEYTVDVGATGTIRLLEAIRSTGLVEKVRYYQASSSEMFGGVDCPPDGYTEQSPFHPRSPYACAKVFAHHAVINYREAYGLRASNGILFNHESPRRGHTFVTRKVTRAIAEILAGRQKKLFLGDLSPRRDWGFAGDYVLAMWLMLQQDQPDDYVIATREGHSVSEFVQKAFRIVGLDWREYIEFDSRYFRPAEVWQLIGNPSKAIQKLSWRPQVSFNELVNMMVREDCQKAGVWSFDP